MLVCVCVSRLGRDQPSEDHSMSPTHSLTYVLCADFDKLTKSIQKAGKDLLINGSLPTFILRCLVQLEDYLKSSMDREKTAKRKMNASNAKAMNIMKQRLRKYTKTVESQLSAYREVCSPG